MAQVHGFGHSGRSACCVTGLLRGAYWIDSQPKQRARAVQQGRALW